VQGQRGSRSESLAFAQGGRLLVSSDLLLLDDDAAPGGSSRIVFWDAARGIPKEVFPNSDGRSLAVDRARQFVAASGGDHVSLFRVLPSDIERRTLQGAPPETTSLSFSVDGGQLVAAGSSRLSTWDTATGQSVLDIMVESDSLILNAAFNSAGTSIMVVGNRDRLIRYFSAKTGKEERRVAWEHSYRQVCASDDRNVFASCGHAQPGVKVWSLNTGRNLATVGAPNRYSHIAISADGRVIIGARVGSTGFDGIDTLHADIR
jgi:WD40 repeat protein